MDDVRERIGSTRPDPSEVTPFDADSLVARGRRQRRLLQVTSALSGLAVVIGMTVGLASWWPVPAPEVADQPEGRVAAAPIGVLDTPQQTQDRPADRVLESAGIDPEAADTVRLARRSPGRAYYLWQEPAPTDTGTGDGPLVCVMVVDQDDEVLQQGCGSPAAEDPNVPRELFVMGTPEVGHVGIASDGAARTSQLARSDPDGREPEEDLPVVNNLFIAPPPPDIALEGRSDEAFCAVAPGPDSEPASLPDSDDPFELLEKMATTAPTDIADDMYLVWDYLRLNPDAIQADTVAFTEPVQEAANRVDDYIRSACRGQPAPSETTATEPDDSAGPT